ncbi:MAG: hypothetical protein ABJV68_06280 [Paracoccaceae bacterium]
MPYPLRNNDYVYARYGVDAFDLEKLIEPSGIRTEGALMSLPHPPGVTQNYVVNRMDGVSNQSPWLDGQGIADGVRACEMIGSLLVDGPQVYYQWRPFLQLKHCLQKIRMKRATHWTRDELLMKTTKLVNLMLPSCESDASSIATVKLNPHRNKGFGSKIVKFMVHSTPKPRAVNRGLGS